MRAHFGDFTADLHLSKALFSLYPDNLQLHCFLGLGALFCCSFFCPLYQPCKTLQMVQVDPDFSGAFVTKVGSEIFELSIHGFTFSNTSVCKNKYCFELSNFLQLAPMVA